MAKSKSPKMGRPPKPGGRTKTVSANVGDPLIAKLDAARAKKRWSRSQAIGFILEKWADAGGRLD